MEMTRTESGLLIPVVRQTQVQREHERRSAREKYRSDHSCCPVCGRNEVSQTTMGYIGFGDTHADRNKARCSCGWKGIVDQMVPCVVTQSGE